MLGTRLGVLGARANANGNSIPCSFPWRVRRCLADRLGLGCDFLKLHHRHPAPTIQYRRDFQRGAWPEEHFVLLGNVRVRFDVDGRLSIDSEKGAFALSSKESLGNTSGFSAAADTPPCSFLAWREILSDSQSNSSVHVFL